MPVIVIGADTRMGGAVIGSLASDDRDVRAFVSDPTSVGPLKAQGVKVALGDVSDASHIGAAAHGCHTAVVIPAAAFDGRERSFSTSPPATAAQWLTALTKAAVVRIVWLEDEGIDPPRGPVVAGAPELTIVPTSGLSLPQIAAEVARIDDLPRIEGGLT